MRLQLQKRESQFLQTLTAAQLKSSFTPFEREALFEAFCFYVENPVFLFPIEVSALASNEREGMLASVLHCLESTGLYHTMLDKLLDVSFCLSEEFLMTGTVDDLCSGLQRIYLFDKGVGYARSLLGDLLLSIVTSEEALTTPSLDLETEKFRVTKLENLLKGVVNCICSAKAISQMPRAVRGMAGVTARAATRNMKGHIVKENITVFVRRLMIEKFFLPLVSLPAEFGLLSAEEAKLVTPEGRKTLLFIAKVLHNAVRNVSPDPSMAKFCSETFVTLERYCETLVVDPMLSEWMPKSWSDLMLKVEDAKSRGFDKTTDVDLGFFVATFVKHCAGSGDWLLRMSGKVEKITLPQDLVENVQLIAQIKEVAFEWQRRSLCKDFVEKVRATITRLDTEIAALDKLVSLRAKKEAHVAAVDLKEKLESLRTFLLLSSKLCNKRAHPTQWQLSEGCVSDLLGKHFAQFSTHFVELRFSLKASIPILANRMMEEEKKIVDWLVGFQESHNKDLLELIVRELGFAETFVHMLAALCPSKGHNDYSPFISARDNLVAQLDLIDRGEIESLLRSYKFQKFTIAGWKEMPKVLLGGSAGIVSSFRTHLIAGLLLHNAVGAKPVRYFAHMFSDCLILLSQIDLSGTDLGASTEKLEKLEPKSSEPRVRTASVLRKSSAAASVITGKERKKVLQRMASESSMAQLHPLDSKKFIFFRVEKVFHLVSRKVQLRLIDRGFIMDGNLEFTVEGKREGLLKWYEAFRKAEVNELEDCAQTAVSEKRNEMDKQRESEKDAGEEDDDDLCKMMEEFSIYDTSVVRKPVETTTEKDNAMEKVLAQVDVYNINHNATNATQSSTYEQLRLLFVPPPNVVPVRIRARTGSVIKDFKGEDLPQEKVEDEPQEKEETKNDVVEETEDVVLAKNACLCPVHATPLAPVFS